MALPGYDKLQQKLVERLKADVPLVAAMAGGLATAITYGRPHTPRVFPCLTIRDIMVAPSQVQHELPMASVLLTCQIDLWGESQHVRAIQSLVDDALESSMMAGAMDVAGFWKVLDMDTHGVWRTVEIPSELSGSIPLEQRSKDYVIHAVALTSGT